MRHVATWAIVYSRIQNMKRYTFRVPHYKTDA